MTRRFVALLVTGLALGACRSAAPSVPTEAASITGRVTDVSRSGERIGSVRVEAEPAVPSGSPKAVVRITQATTILTSTPESATDFNALRVGQWVRVWFTGPVRESYPLQADAGTVVVDSGGGTPR
jgi:beta-N-acetylhexosaminidase